MADVIPLRKPCPFCGEQGAFDPDGACIMCDGCQAAGPSASGGCSVDDSDDATQRAAWAFWNDRKEASRG
jgi:hypothetical protein